MAKILKRLPLVALLAMAGCAVEPMLPFQLIDAGSRAYVGSLDGSRQTMEVLLDDVRYAGIYVVATSVAVSPQPWFPRRPFPIDMTTSVRGNSARAYLQSSDGRHLGCEFTFEGRRAVGECRTPDGKTYQLVAGLP